MKTVQYLKCYVYQQFCKFNISLQRRSGSLHIFRGDIDSKNEGFIVSGLKLIFFKNKKNIGKPNCDESIK